MKSSSNIRRFFRNFSFLAVGKILGDLFTFAFFVVLSRKFGQEGIGNYSFAMALTGFFVVFADFGLGSLCIKEMSRLTDSLGEYFGDMLLLRFLLAVTVFGALFSLLPFLSFSRETILIIAIIGTYQIVYSLVDGFASVFIARQDMHFVGLIEVSLRMFTSLIGIVMIKTGFGLVAALSVLPVVTVLHLAVAYVIMVRRYGRPVIRWSLSNLITKLRDSVPYGFSGIINQLNTRLDVVFLGFLIGASAAGVYNVGYRIVFLLMFASRFIGTTLFPVASKLFVDSQTKLRDLYNQSLNYACLIGLPIASGLWLISHKLINLVFGQAFAESALILQYLSWLLFLVFFRSIMGVFLTSCDRQKTRAKSQFVAACINILGNVVLIPIIGIKGAAIATLCAELVLIVLYVWRLQDLLGWPGIASRLIMSTIATSVFVLPLLFFKGLPLIIEIPLASLLYGGTLLLFKSIRKNEFRVLVNFMRSGLKKEVLAS